MLNFPNTVQLGSVVDVDVRSIPEKIDLLIGGSPCQSFSFAGKRNGMSTKCEIEILSLSQYLELKQEGFDFEGQSYLFWEYMRILTDIRRYNNPNVFFLLENVEMGSKWERVLSNAIGVFGVHINSALVSAQNRKRIYWTNIRTKQVGLFGELHADIPQPKGCGILLKDILESEVAEKYYLSDKMIAYLNSGSKSQSANRIVDKNTKTQSLMACDYKIAQCVEVPICVAMRGRNPDNPSDRTTGAPTEQRLEPNTSGETNCLTSVQKDNLVMQLNPSTESGGKQPYQQNRVYDSKGISPALCANKADLMIIQKPRGFNDGGEYKEKTPTLSANSWEQNNLLHSNYRIRRLTPIECARLQTIPDWYRWECSDTQAYRMLGNGWTVKVIQHIFSFFPFKKK